MRHLYLVVAVLIIFSSCRDESISSDLESSFRYYPLEVGNTWIYAVDSMLYLQGGISRDTSSTFIKEEITAQLSSTLDEDYVLTRSLRKSENDPWQISDVWTVSRNGNRITKTEENLEFVKLQAPVSEGSTWAPYALFDNFIEVSIGGEIMAPYTNNEASVEINSTEVIEGVEFDEVIKVAVGQEFNNNIAFRDRNEWYAKDIGLIYKKEVVLDCRSSECDTTVPWLDRARQGYTMEMRLLSFTN